MHIRGSTFNKNKNQNSTYPTVALESLILTAVIGAHVGRYVTVYGITGAYISSDMDE